MKKIVLTILLSTVFIVGCDADKEILKRAKQIEKERKELSMYEFTESRLFNIDGRGNKTYIQEVKIDGCEYIIITGHVSYRYPWKSITHKGNCKNCKK